MTELFDWWWHGGLPFPLSSVFFFGGLAGLMLMVRAWLS